MGIHHFHIGHDAPCLPPKICITIFFDFSWDDCNTQENWKQLLCKILGDEQNKKGAKFCGLCENGKREALLPHPYPKSPLVPPGIPHRHSMIIMTKRKTHDNQA